MSKHYCRAGIFCSVLTVVTLGNLEAAMAQDLQKNNTLLDEILVTVEKTEQKAQDVPAALTVITKSDIKNSAITNLQELDNYTPNLTLSDQGSPRFTINTVRGIGTTVRDDYFSASIGVYLDGVPLTAAEFSRSLGDLERVEILRGPQGTLYGRNTAAGVINMVSRAPTNETEAEISGTIGNNGKHRVSGFVSGPVVNDKLFARLFFDYTSRDSFTDYLSSGDGIDDLESYTGSGTLVFAPNSKTKISLNASVERVDQGAYAFLPFDDYKKRKLDLTPPNREDRDSESGTLNIEHDLGFAQLKMISGIRHYEILSDQDMGFHPSIVAFGGGSASSIEEGTQFSQEVRLSGKLEGDKYRWLIGGFYQWDKVEYDYTFDVPAFGAPSTSSSVYERDEIAIFGEATVKLLDNLEFTSGVRVSRDSHEVSMNTPFVGEEDYTLVTPKFRLAYQMTDDQLFYVSATRGSRTGGFNRLSGDQYDPEYLWSYEAGFKSSFYNNSLMITGAVFYIDWTDQQIRTEVSPGVAKIENAGSSHSQGFELEAKWKPSERWEFSGFLGLTSGEYDEFTNRNGVNLSGNSLANSPAFNAGAAVQYEIPLVFVPWNAHIRGEYVFTGEHYFDPENSLKQSGYGLVNLNAGIKNETISITAYVKNLFDKDYRAYGYETFSTSIPYDIAIPGEDRTYGLTVSAKF